MASEHPLAKVAAMLRQAGAEVPAPALMGTPESGVTTGLSIALAVIESQMAPKPMNPWIPMTDPVDIKHMTKALEELGECSSATARCLLQGIDEAEPVTGKVNREWLQEEVADVFATLEMLQERFGLDVEFMKARIIRKKKQLREWHAMAAGPSPEPTLPAGWAIEMGDKGIVFLHPEGRPTVQTYQISPSSPLYPLAFHLLPTP